MLQNKKIAVLLPAYNAAETLAKTCSEIPREIVDEILLVDDGSVDKTVEIAHELKLRTIVHPFNLGYGGNQKTCYTEALKLDADVFILLHPDYQYSPRLIPAMASMVVSNVYDLVLGSRILGGTALRGGMPVWKYFANRALTLFENALTLAKLSEYHTGYRAFSRQILEELPWQKNSDGFVFDNQIILQALYFGFRIGEISCPTHYAADSSSINFGKSLGYGLGVIGSAIQFRFQKMGLMNHRIFQKDS
jgi:glycosyltransferase involved in cell wall biosynthesis